METRDLDDEDVVRDLLRTAYPPLDREARGRLREHLLTAPAQSASNLSRTLPESTGSARVRRPWRSMARAWGRLPAWRWAALAAPVVAVLVLLRLTGIAVPGSAPHGGSHVVGHGPPFRAPVGPSTASCAFGLGDLDRAIAWGHVVFVGTVTAVENQGTTATVRVEDVWKGTDVPALVQVDGALGAESRYFRVGTRYLFIPDNTPSPYTRSPYQASVCGTWPYDSSLASFRPAGAHAPISTTSELARGQGGARMDSTPQWLASLAHRVAAQDGDDHPTGGQYVLTTRQTAMDATNAGKVDSNQAVYLVVLEGHFIHDSYTGPLGSHPPRGTVVTLTVDPATHEILDYGLNHTAPDLAPLGTVHTLPR